MNRSPIEQIKPYSATYPLQRGELITGVCRFISKPQLCNLPHCSNIMLAELGYNALGHDLFQVIARRLGLAQARFHTVDHVLGKSRPIEIKHFPKISTVFVIRHFHFSFLR
jgi:hypothetical protein